VNSGATLSYDAENRMTGVSGSPALQYAYDAQNYRFFSWNGAFDTYGNANGYTLFLYSPSGQKLAAYTVSSTPQSSPYLTAAIGTSDMYFGGRRLAVMDRLGSAGKYYPYGEDRGTPLNDTWNYATYWRDSATGFDYAMSRYYSNSLGRFLTPDPYKASGGPKDPGSWNRYMYTRGDPVNRTDPYGTCDEGEDCDPCSLDPGNPVCDPPSPFQPPAPQPTVTITCGVTLFSQPIRIDSPLAPKHTYLDLTLDVNVGGVNIVTNTYIEGLPVNKQTGAVDDNPKTAGIPNYDWLNVFAEPAPHYGNTPSTQLWTSGNNLTDCPAMFSVALFAQSFPKNTYGYNAEFGYNSNTITSALLAYYALPLLPPSQQPGLLSTIFQLNGDIRYVGWGAPIPPWPLSLP